MTVEEAATLLAVPLPLGRRRDLQPRLGRDAALRWSALRRMEHWLRLAKAARTEARRHRAWLRYNVAAGLAMLMIAHAHGEAVEIELNEAGELIVEG